jgi:hypothetical protein
MADGSAASSMADRGPARGKGFRSIRRMTAWGLIVVGVAAFVVAGDVRTNWVVGDTGPQLAGQKQGAPIPEGDVAEHARDRPVLIH